MRRRMDRLIPDRIIPVRLPTPVGLLQESIRSGWGEKPKMRG